MKHSRCQRVSFYYLLLFTAALFSSICYDHIQQYFMCHMCACVIVFVFWSRSCALTIRLFVSLPSHIIFFLFKFYAFFFKSFIIFGFVVFFFWWMGNSFFFLHHFFTWLLLLLFTLEFFPSYSNKKKKIYASVVATVYNAFI